MADVIVILIIISIVALIIRSLKIDKKNGKGHCGGNCSQCGKSCSSLPKAFKK